MNRKTRRALVLTSLLLAILVFATGCGGQDGGSTSKDSDEILIGHMGKEGNLLIYLAQELGYFNEEGIDAELKQFESDEEGIQAVIDGEIDAGGFKTMPELLAIDAGEDLKVFSGGQQVGSGILTLEENDSKYDFLKNYRDGKTIATTRETMEDVIVRAAILRMGLVIDEDIYVVEYDSPEAVAEAIKNGEVDSGAICLSDLSEEDREGLRLAVPSNELLEKHPTYTQITKASYLEDEAKHDLFYRYNRAMIRSYKYYLENPEETVDIILQYVEKDRDLLMSDIYNENKEFVLEEFWPNPNPIRAYNWKFLQDLETFDYLQSDKDIVNDFAHDPCYTDAMNDLAEETGDAVYVELQSIHVC